MRRINRTFWQVMLCAIYCMLCSKPLLAQLPKMVVQQSNANINPIALNGLDIDVKIVGNIATTTMIMTFCNNSSQTLEGTLTFPMPDGVSVNRYALDINGKLREAVPVEKAKATEVFESIERRRVDPGLLEKVEGNNFRTRVYPLLPGVNRIVAVGYSQRLSVRPGNGLHYYLPFDFNMPIPDFSLQVTVADGTQQPTLIERPNKDFEFVAKGNNWHAVLKRKNFIPQRSLEIAIPQHGEIPKVAMEKTSDNRYYFLANVQPNVRSIKRIWPDKLGIIWDVSLSSRQRDLQKELALLEQIIVQKKNLKVEVALLNHRFIKGRSFNIEHGNMNALRNYLQQMVYDGATDYSAIKAGVLDADEYLMFSDGLSTFGANTIQLRAPVHCIVSNNIADYSTLKSIAMAHGGIFVNLNEYSPSRANELISNQPLQFLGYKTNHQITEVNPAPYTFCGDDMLVTGICNGSSASLVLQFGFGKRVVKEVTVKLEARQDEVAQMDIHKIWAQEKIARLDIDYYKNKDEIAALGKQFGIVTRNTSLMVLENVEDYVRYEITPPAELRAEYHRLLKQGNTLKEQRVADLLQQAINMTEMLKHWHSQNLVPKRRYPIPVSEERFGVETRDEAMAAPAPPPPARVQEVTSASPTMRYTAPQVALNSEVKSVQLNEESIEREKALEEVVLTRRNPQQIHPYPNATGAHIVVPDFKSDQEYMHEMNRVSPKYAYNRYLKLREQYITTPLFYFNMACWFYAHKDSSTALMIMSNIAELQIEDAELYKMLAYKLKQVGQYEYQLFVTRKVLEWRPMDAQSVRDYGLALADAGRFQQALDTLYSILLKSYSPQAADRDDGLEEIIVAEINNLISLHKQELNTTRIDKNIIASMPVDIRVVLNWNKNDTDIDLWVTSPNGEQCYYGNKETNEGGRMSNDFTSGYGPEQFMLRRAQKGTYKIETNYFGDSQLSISGATTLMAEIYLHYSSGKQERRVIVMQSGKENKDGKLLVGTFNF